MLRREFPYLEITIEEYCNEFIEKYRNDKNFNKLIRSNVFTPDYMRRGCRDFNSNTRCKGQITYVKFNDNNLICNIKVCGVIGTRYYSDDVINLVLYALKDGISLKEVICRYRVSALARSARFTDGAVHSCTKSMSTK